MQACPIHPKTAGVVIDDTPEHRAYYKYQLSKHPEITIVDQAALIAGAYLFKITKQQLNYHEGRAGR